MRRLLLRFKSRRTLALHGGRPLFSERQTLTRVVRTTQVVACKSYLNVDILVLPFEQLAEDTEFHRVSEGRAKNPVSRPPTNFYRNLVKLLAGDQRMSATVATARNR